MKILSRVLLATVLLVLPFGAEAQIYGSNAQPAPLYPYAVQRNQPYAVQVAPNTYIIERPQQGARSYPYVGPAQAQRAARPAPARAQRNAARNDPALVEELSRRHRGNASPKGNVINTTQVVRGKPIVVETTRYVDDPPRVVDRYVDENGVPIADVPQPMPPAAVAPAPRQRMTARVIEREPVLAPEPAPPKRTMRDERKTRVAPAKEAKDGKQRVIRAEAEVTILGPDRMSIRLFRKGSRNAANALADEAVD